LVIEYATSREASDPYCLRPGEAAALLAGHPWQRFVVVGDSVAEGVGDPVDGYVPLAWTDRIATELRLHTPDLTYRNLGRRNRRAAQVREQQLADALAFDPDLALVSCGAADTMDPSFNPDLVSPDIAAILSALRDRRATVITVEVLILAGFPGLPPAQRPAMANRLRLLNRCVRELAGVYDTVHIDLSTHPACGDADMHSGDGMHGNGRSHAISAAEAIRRIGGHLGNTFVP